MIILIIFSSDNILFPLFLIILPIIKFTSSITNVLTNNLSQPLPNSNTPSSQRYGRELANLTKIYIDKAKNNGKNNSFAFKLIIFYNILIKANVPEEILLKAFPLCAPT